jgi:hypothetical protein
MAGAVVSAASMMAAARVRVMVTIPPGFGSKGLVAFGGGRDLFVAAKHLLFAASSRAVSCGLLKPQRDAVAAGLKWMVGGNLVLSIAIVVGLFVH